WFPPAWNLEVLSATTMKPSIPWGVHLLPYLEQDNLYKMMDLTSNITATGGVMNMPPNNIAAISTPLALFQCPTSPGHPRVYTETLPAAATGLPFAVTWKAAASDYTATGGILGNTLNNCFNPPGGGDRHGALKANEKNGALSIRDGLSNTILVGEL